MRKRVKSLCVMILLIGGILYTITKINPLAFTEAMMEGDHFMTGQFAWDYENEKLGMGTYATLYEIKYCIDQKYKYYYFLTAMKIAVLISQSMMALSFGQVETGVKTKRYIINFVVMIVVLKT